MKRTQNSIAIALLSLCMTTLCAVGVHAQETTATPPANTSTWQGPSLGSPDTWVGSVVVDAVRDSYSTAKVTSGTGMQRGDAVRAAARTKDTSGTSDTSARRLLSQAKATAPAILGAASNRGRTS